MNATTKIEYNGQIITKSDIAKMGNLPWYVVDQRLKCGWSVDRILKTPIRKLKTRHKIPKTKLIAACWKKTREECLSCTKEHCVFDDYGDEE